MSAVRVAFFDVDETLVTVKSMFGFLAEYFDAEEYERAEKHLKGLAAAGVPRDQSNREYYRMFAGHSAAEIADHGRAWYERAFPTLYNEATLGWLRRYQNGGAAIVLVSGSFPACLDPIADHVFADRVLCGQPAVVDGKHTGELVGEPVIGEGKARAVRATMAELGVSAQDCVAFGDHSTDLPMLQQVGRRVVVGDDPGLRPHLTSPGWFRLADLGAHQPV
ncbi:HAD family hydrolase [Actinokineospora diospyrosa]|uniref:HAD-superfamily subfamily IB hydrolase, TIGR01490 n=1 Tax=Actinokineospora diospyrosa TaxID=103728 RepID=A0ABT1IIZ5_9PSEU|nr:HAD-IB family hydrolase [Actinokineospora diospyrosa]MCP2272615.1 HAD-superfamily subfamily IB hydrolase, TIGR01490 [Actinokineospora diospyrosa]